MFKNQKIMFLHHLTRAAPETPLWATKVAQSGADWTREGLKCATVAQGGLEWPRVAQRGTRLAPDWHQRGPEWHIVAKSGSDWIRESLKCVTVAQGGLEWPRMVGRGIRVAPGRPIVAQSVPDWPV